MNILYAAVFEEHAGWGAEYFVNSALRNLGHSTHTIDYRKHRWHLADKVLEAPSCDAFLLQRGEVFPLELVRAVRPPRLYWASELVSRRRDQDRLLSSGLFDHIFVRTPECRSTIAERGWQEPDDVSLLLSAFDPSTHRSHPDAGEPIDVLFVGSLTPRRRKILRRLRDRFSVEVRSAFGEEMSRLFNRARIVLNIHAEDHLDTETRVFEALGAGAFLITERLSAENPFESGIHLVEVDSIEHLVEAVDHYLARPDERESIARRGQAEALENHTYEARARQIVSEITRARGASALDTPFVDVGAAKAYAATELWSQARLTLRRSRDELSHRLHQFFS